MPKSIYEIFADGVKIGITVASNATMALQSARLTTTRHTYSKMDTTCDYESLVVSKANAVLLAIGAPLDAMTLVRPVFTVNNSPLPRVMGYGLLTMLACRSSERNSRVKRSVHSTA